VSAAWDHSPLLGIVCRLVQALAHGQVAGIFLALQYERGHVNCPDFRQRVEVLSQDQAHRQ